MTTSLFFIYDPQDGEYLSQIENQIKVLVNNKTLSYWHEGLLAPGVDWRKVRDEKLRSADMVLPIVSANFLASDNCTGLLEDAYHQGKQIVPIIANHCLWDMNDILAKQSPIPKKPNDTKATPICDWEEPTRAYAAIVRAIRELRGSWQISEQPIEPEKTTVTTPNPIQNTNMSTNQIKSLIAQGKLKQALDLMPDTSEVIMLKSRFNQLERAERMGIISYQDATIERARITNATLQILGNDDTPDQWETPPTIKQNNTQNIISQATTLVTQQEFAQAFALLDTLNLQQALYYQLKKEYTSGTYKYDPQYSDRLITFVKIVK